MRFERSPGITYFPNRLADCDPVAGFGYYRPFLHVSEKHQNIGSVWLDNNVISKDVAVVELANPKIRVTHQHLSGPHHRLGAHMVARIGR